METRVPERSLDAIALEELASSGSDLSLLHHVEFRLRFPAQKAAERAASLLVPLAFSTSTERDATSSEWVVVASKVMFPVGSDLMGLRDKLDAIAAMEEGVYVGWKAKLARQ